MYENVAELNDAQCELCKMTEQSANKMGNYSPPVEKNKLQ